MPLRPTRGLDIRYEAGFIGIVPENLAFSDQHHDHLALNRRAAAQDVWVTGRAGSFRMTRCNRPISRRKRPVSRVPRGDQQTPHRGHRGGRPPKCARGPVSSSSSPCPDLAIETSLTLRLLYHLVVMDQFTRRLVGVGVHRGPVNGADLCRMFNAAIQGRGAPRYLSTDHDPLFEAHRWTANLRILEIDEIKTVPHVPRSTPIRGAPDRHDAARISRPCAVLTYP